MNNSPLGIRVAGLLVIAGLATMFVGCKDKPPADTSAGAPAPETGEKLTAENAKTQLFEAVKAGELERVRAAVKFDATLVNSKDGPNRSPLHEAVAAGQKPVVSFLIANKANVNAKDGTGATPLHLVALTENKEIAALLVAANADVNAKDNTGSTPLHIAAFNGMRPIVEFLTANKADPTLKNKDGFVAWQMAQKGEKADIVGLLRAQEAVVARAKAESEVDRKRFESQKKRAADGQSTAQYDMGMRYIRGDGVEKDDAKAREWLGKAAANGSVTAAKILKDLDAKAAAGDTKSEPKPDAKADPKP